MATTNKIKYHARHDPLALVKRNAILIFGPKELKSNANVSQSDLLDQKHKTDNRYLLQFWSKSIALTEQKEKARAL